MSAMTHASDAALAEWIATTPATWLGAAAGEITNALFDTLGCALAADDHPQRLAVACLHAGSVDRWARPTAGQSSAPSAAMVNATASHALDFDDVLLSGRSHASAVLVPTVLAVGDMLGADGPAVATAFVVGLETMHVVAKAASLDDYLAGWHTTITHGIFGAAAATARLLELDPSQTTNALSLALSMAAGGKRQFGTGAKPVHAGLAAQHGIQAALLAAAGVDAAPDPIFGAGGYVATYANRTAQPVPEPVALDAVASIIADTPEGLAHLWRKPYPCCASTHASIDAVLATVTPSRASDVAAIAVRLNALDVSNLPYARPRSTGEARFSLPFCVAIAAVRGRVTESDFASPSTPWRTSDDVESLLDRVTVTLDDTFAPGGERSGELQVTWVDGTVETVDLGLPTGHPARPLADAAVRSKIINAVADGADLVSPLATFVGGGQVRSLASLLAAPSGAASSVPYAGSSNAPGRAPVKRPE